MNIDIVFKDDTDKNYKIFINELKTLRFNQKVAIITNPKVSGLHLKNLLNNIEAKEIYIITVGDGEVHKNLDTVNFILDRLFDHKIDRKSLLVAFGGGVIGDMTGFAASIFQRGIDFLQIPTTLLSQVDASVGGKTGINNKYGKNLVGAFHQPVAVYCETDFLKTLPKREFSAGVSEIVKMAVMFDKDFFGWLENADLKKEEDLQYAIKRSIELKAKVVMEDEKEKGVRAALNYGHTFAHVIENLTNYSLYLHGEAVSIGMMMANVLAMKLGLLTFEENNRIKSILQKHSLPVNYDVKDIEAFYEGFFLDKKSFDLKIKYILPDGIGRYKMKNDIEKDIVISSIKEFN